MYIPGDMYRPANSDRDSNANANVYHVLTNVGPEGSHAGPFKLASDVWSPTPVCFIGETCTPTCNTGFADDALVQQVNGSIGYEMQVDMGSAVPGENFCTGYCFDRGSERDAIIGLQPANELF